jgi:hypothetical protein
MSLYLTIYSNALHQTDYRPTPPASLLHKLLHRLLCQFSRSQCRPNHAANEFTLHLRVLTPYKQPMSPLLMTPHVTERMSNALLCCRPRSPRAPKSTPISLPFPYDTTLQTTVPLLTAPISLSFHQWHNPRNQESYLILSTSLPCVARCVSILHTTQPSSIQYLPTYVANEFITSSPARPSPTLLAVRVFQRPIPRQDPSPVAARTFAFSRSPLHRDYRSTLSRMRFLHRQEIASLMILFKLHPAKLHPAK